MTNNGWSHKTVNELEDFLKKKIAMPGTEDYIKATDIWAVVDYKPAMGCMPYSIPGGYPNILGCEQQEQIAHAHGSNLSRLKSIKQTFDPRGVFSAQPLAV